MDPIEVKLMDFLSEFVTDDRKVLIEQVLEKRTRFVSVALEDIYQSQNASAVVRTCDCFGIQDLHIIENDNDYRINPKVVHGASKWVDIYQYNEFENNTSTCFQHLKDEGYTVVGTVPDPDALSIYDYSFETPTVLAFGTEATGLSPLALEMCDELVTFPMAGFTESLNISVSASLCLSVAMHKVLSANCEWHLTEEEKEEIRLGWYKYSVSRSDVLEREFRKKMK